jgi:hypothetical protein
MRLSAECNIDVVDDKNGKSLQVALENMWAGWSDRSVQTVLVRVCALGPPLALLRRWT